MVFGQHNPFVFPHLGQPFRILRVGREVIVVDVNGYASQAEGCGYALLSEGAVEEKMGDSGGFEPKFAPDGFLDFEPMASIIVCQIVH